MGEFEKILNNARKIDKLHPVPVVVSIVLLFLALFELPSGYYTLLRIIVCGTATYLSILAVNKKKKGWGWFLGFVAVLFNPFIPIHFDKGLWVVIDAIVGVSFGFVLLILTGRVKLARILGGSLLVLISGIFVISYLVTEAERQEAERRRIERRAEMQQRMAEQRAERERLEVKQREERERREAEQELHRAEQERLQEEREQKEAKRRAEMQQRMAEQRAEREQQEAERKAREDSDFVFKNENFKVVLRQPYWGTIRDREASRTARRHPHLVFEFEYEIINENAIVNFWRAGVSGKSDGGLGVSSPSLTDNFGNNYSLRREVMFDAGKFRVGHKDKVIYATEELPVEHATHLYLEFSSISRSPLGPLFERRRFVIPIEEIKDFPQARN